MSEADDPIVPYDGVFTDVATAEMKEPTWIIKGLLPVGLTFIGAPPKSHKSGITMAMAALSAGYQCGVLPAFMTEVVNGGPVLGFSYEATAGEIRHMLEVGMGVRLRPDSSILVADDPWLFRLDEPEGIGQLLGWLDGRGPRVVIIDPLRDFHHLEEKDSGGMNKMLRPLRQWAVHNDASVIVVHHTKKLDEVRDYTANDLRGTTALFGIADCVLMMTPVDAHATVKMQATFKRAKGWERTVQLAIYDWIDRPARELLGTNERKVWKAVQDGAVGTTELAAVTKLSPEVVLDCMAMLQRNQLV